MCFPLREKSTFIAKHGAAVHQSPPKREMHPQAQKTAIQTKSSVKTSENHGDNIDFHKQNLKWKLKYSRLTLKTKNEI